MLSSLALDVPSLYDAWRKAGERSSISPKKRKGRIARMKVSAAMLVVGFMLSAGAVAEDVHSVAQAVDEHYNHLRSLQAEFTEIYRGSGMERTEAGTLWLAEGGVYKTWQNRGG